MSRRAGVLNERCYTHSYTFYSLQYYMLEWLCRVIYAAHMTTHGEGLIPRIVRAGTLW